MWDNSHAGKLICRYFNNYHCHYVSTCRSNIRFNPKTKYTKYLTNQDFHLIIFGFITNLIVNQLENDHFSSYYFLYFQVQNRANFDPVYTDRITKFVTLIMSE